MSTKLKAARNREIVKPIGAPIVCYADGSCNSRSQCGGWGVVILDGEDEFTYSGGARGVTNNLMEMAAAEEAMYVLYNKRLEHRPITIMTDSQYLVGGMHEWRGKWERSDFDKVKNVRMWQSLHRLHDRFACCTFAWVRGHIGHYYNELVDKLANEGRKGVE